MVIFKRKLDVKNVLKLCEFMKNLFSVFVFGVCRVIIVIEE